MHNDGIIEVFIINNIICVKVEIVMCLIKHLIK